MCSKYVCTRWAVQLSALKPTLEQLAKAVAAVQPEERVRLMRFHFIDDFMLSLVGRLLMRKFVSEQTKQPYHEVRFVRDDKNKPYWLQGNEHKQFALSFSTSHQGAMVVLAGISAQDAENQIAGVGVDVMKIEYTGGKSLSEFFRVMKKIFTPNEWTYIQHPAFNERQQLHAFMRLWTLKEAYTKEQGVGILMNLQNLSFNVKSSQKDSYKLPIVDTELYVRNELAKNYKFEEHLLHDAYCVALAFHDVQVPTDNFSFLNFNELLVDSDAEKQCDIIDYCNKVLQKEYKQNGIYA